MQPDVLITKLSNVTPIANVYNFMTTILQGQKRRR
jgi:hypothetical protein